MKLYLDEAVPVVLARQLRLRGFDVLTTQEAGRLGSSDPEQLEFAAAEGRVIVSYDHDFYELGRIWFLEGRQHSGIVIAHDYRPEELRRLINLCLNLFDRETEESMANAIYPLEQYR